MGRDVFKKRTTIPSIGSCFVVFSRRMIISQNAGGLKSCGKGEGLLPGSLSRAAGLRPPPLHVRFRMPHARHLSETGGSDIIL